MSPGKLTRPVKAGDESGAAKIGADLVAELVGDAPETEAFPLQWSEEDMLDAIRANPELYWGSTSQKSKIRHEQLKKAAEASEPAPAVAAPAETPAGEGGGLSPLAARFAEDPETEARIRSAIAELDQKAIDQAAIENLYAEDEVDSWTWPEVDEGEGGGS